ncbi:MATE family efflux transporter [Altererythrobacter sp. CAU 1778]
MTQTDAFPKPGAHPWRTEIRATFALAWPLALANLLQMLVFALDVIFIARLGERPLAASSLAMALFGTAMWMFIGATGMVSALIAAALGEGRGVVRKVRRATRMALWLSVLCGLLVMVMCWFGESILLATGQETDIAAMAGRYLRILMWATIPAIAANVLRSYVSSLGRPYIATLVLTMQIGVAAATNYIFIFGKLGVPAMGIEGAAIASVITAVFTLFAYVALIARYPDLSRYRIFGRLWVFDPVAFRTLAVTGAPVALTILAEAGLFNSAALMMGLFGTSQLAGHTLALQIAALAFQVPFGVGQAATIRVGYFFGARDREGMGRAGWTGIAMGVGFMALTASIMVFAPHAVLRIYIDPFAPENAAMVAYAIPFLLVAAAFQLFDGLQAVAAGALRGLQDTRTPMFIAIVSFWVPGLGAMWWLGLNTPLEGIGLWIGLLVALVCVAFALTWRWQRRDALGLTTRLPAQPA